VTGGAAEFITEGERIEDKVLRTFGRIGSPQVSDVEIDYGGAEVEQAPRVAGPIFDGDALRVFARVRSSQMPEVVTLKCSTARGPRSWSVKLRDAHDAANVLPTFWARAMIRAIEEGDESAILASTSTSGESRDKARLISLSKQYSLLCGQTSFIAIEHRSLEDRNQGEPALRRVPVMLAKGWGDVEGEMAAGGTMYACAAPMAAPPSPARFKDSRKRSPGGLGGVMRSLGRMFGGGTDADKIDLDALRKPRHLSAPRQEPERLMEQLSDAFAGGDSDDLAPSGSASDDLVTLLAAQQADGSFKLTAAIEKMLADLGVSVSTLRAAAKKHGGASTAVIDTLTVLAVLKSAFIARQAAWKRAAKKASAFVAAQMKVDAKQVEAWVAAMG
jgi:hypothetical protein